VLVQQVVMPGSRRESWTVLGEDGVPVEPVERFLAFLTDVERSPNTVKAYAHDLKERRGRPPGAAGGGLVRRRRRSRWRGAAVNTALAAAGPAASGRCC
jgi:hypothetical protein